MTPKQIGLVQAHWQSLQNNLSQLNAMFYQQLFKAQPSFKTALIERAKVDKHSVIEMLAVDDLAIHQEHLRGIINHHFEATGSLRAQEILHDFDKFAPLFKLIKPTATDVKTLLGHRSRSSAELRVQAQ